MVNLRYAQGRIEASLVQAGTSGTCPSAPSGADFASLIGGHAFSYEPLVALIGGEPGGAANLNEFPSGAGLHQMRFDGRPVIRRQVTDDFRYAAAQSRSCQIKCTIDCRHVRHAHRLTQAPGRAKGCLASDRSGLFRAAAVAGQPSTEAPASGHFASPSSRRFADGLIEFTTGRTIGLALRPGPC